MEEEPSTSSGIKRSIPQELQDEIDEIVSKRPRATGIRTSCNKQIMTILRI